MKAKEFRETWRTPSYEMSGQTYYRKPVCNNDLDDQMNEFFNKNQGITIVSLKYRKGRALLIYKEDGS